MHKTVQNFSNIKDQIKSKINETDHYLFRYLLKPGLKKSVFGCTIHSSDISIYNKKKLLVYMEIILRASNSFFNIL